MTKTGRKVTGIAASVAAILTAATAVIAAFEGLRTKPYRDPVGVMTVCYGETSAQMRTYTPDECAQLLRERIARDYAPAVFECVPSLMRAPDAAVAAISFAYNVGVGAFCKSTMANKMRIGDIRGGCDEFKRWVYAGGRQLPGLVKRREVEADLCYRDA